MSDKIFCRKPAELIIASGEGKQILRISRDALCMTSLGIIAGVKKLYNKEGNGVFSEFQKIRPGCKVLVRVSGIGY